MIYKFTSKASGDVIMLGPQGDEVMRLLGREPAPRGIVDVADMASAVQVLEAASASPAAGDPAKTPAGPAHDTEREPTVHLRQRLWPLLDMLRRCQAAGQPVVWGV